MMSGDHNTHNNGPFHHNQHSSIETNGGGTQWSLMVINGPYMNHYQTTTDIPSLMFLKLFLCFHPHETTPYLPVGVV